MHDEDFFLCVAFSRLFVGHYVDGKEGNERGRQAAKDLGPNLNLARVPLPKACRHQEDILC